MDKTQGVQYNGGYHAIVVGLMIRPLKRIMLPFLVVIA